MRLAVVTLAAAMVWAQDAPDKPEPRQKARALLDGAAGMMASAQPQIQVVGLMHLAGNYYVFDSARALEYFRQAFAAAAELPPSGAGHDERAMLQGEIVRQTADIDLPAAIGFLKLITPLADMDRDPRDAALKKVIGMLAQREQHAEALALIESLGATGAYPYSAVGQVIDRLPKEDPRRVTAFGAAMAAFANRPRRDFGALLARYWNAVAQPMALSATDSFVNWILDREDPSSTLQSLSTAKGSVTFATRQEAELFDIMHVLREVNPKRADELLEKYPGLKAALARFPRGTESMMLAGGGLNSATTRSSRKIDAEAEGQQRLNAAADSRAAAVLTWVRQDPRKAVDLVPTIPTAGRQAETLGAIAQAVGDKDAALAKQVLGKCIALLDDVKDPALRVRTWEIVAEAAHRAQDDKLVWQAIDRGMNDAAALFDRDFDAASPNQALREYWPSTQSYRRIVAAATRIFGAEAEPLLARIGDPDLALLARIEMAQVLLGRAPSNGMVSVGRVGK